MTADEIAKFYGGLLKDLYKLEGSEKPEKLGPKLDSNGDMVPKATKLKAYDEKAKEILKCDSYIGRGSGGPNIGNKLKLVAAHLLGKYMIDQNTFSEVIPVYYKRIDINFDDYEKLIEASTNVASKVAKSRVAKI